MGEWLAMRREMAAPRERTRKRKRGSVFRRRSAAVHGTSTGRTPPRSASETLYERLRGNARGATNGRADGGIHGVLLAVRARKFGHEFDSGPRPPAQVGKAPSQPG